MLDPANRHRSYNETTRPYYEAVVVNCDSLPLYNASELKKLRGWIKGTLRITAGNETTAEFVIGRQLSAADLGLNPRNGDKYILRVSCSPFYWLEKIELSA